MAEPRKVVLASRNADKVRELKQLFRDLPFDVLSAADFPGLPEVIEDGTTILGNSTRKAIITAAFTGEIAVADDTALQVRELNSMPDIFAARFAGPQATYNDNAELMLELMENVPADARQARFETSCVWIDPRPEVKGKPAVKADSFVVRKPAERRWLRNPFAKGGGRTNGALDTKFWNSVLDRADVWAGYSQQVLTVLATQGHDVARLSEVIKGLLAVEEETGMRMPDPRIWAVSGPDTVEEPLTTVVPAGLPANAPGLVCNGPFWLEVSATGRLLGKITSQPVGARGFGYDPIFCPDGETRTLAEMPSAAKNAISHRGRALRRLMVAVKATYSE